MNAARNGKQVTAVVELRARFDESSNIYWSRKMEEAGVKVIYGTPGLKVHAKMTYFVRREGGREVSYASVSTGNFHEGNANVYTDFSLFTADKRIANEVSQVFSFIEQPYMRYTYRHLLCAPLSMREELLRLVDNEIQNAARGVEAGVSIKVNNLVDGEVIEKLYEASNANVPVKLAVRGICSLIPGVKGLSENVEAVSIVDRYLEHSRIFIFANGGKPRYYLSSADLMRRNLNQRVEIAMPVYNPRIQSVLQHIVDYAMRDNVKARKLDASQSNKIVVKGKQPFRSQEELRKYLGKL
jgi:polyphosphate kinase